MSDSTSSRSTAYDKRSYEAGLAAGRAEEYQRGYDAGLGFAREVALKFAALQKRIDEAPRAVVIGTDEGTELLSWDMPEQVPGVIYTRVALVPVEEKPAAEHGDTP